ncbi:MAG: hypothetical protein HY582_00425 [Candidatus Omnitrophica bacterium]|nr:hypothetical protein [Candidatus Omnitrophota bacterium]
MKIFVGMIILFFCFSSSTFAEQGKTQRTSWFRGNKPLTQAKVSFGRNLQVSDPNDATEVSRGLNRRYRSEAASPIRVNAGEALDQRNSDQENSGGPTDNELATLRLYDLMNKHQIAEEQIAKAQEKKNETEQEVIDNLKP